MWPTINTCVSVRHLYCTVVTILLVIKCLVICGLAVYYLCYLLYCIHCMCVYSQVYQSITDLIILLFPALSQTIQLPSPAICGTEICNTMQ